MTDAEYLKKALDRFYVFVVVEATERIAGLGPCHWWVGGLSRGGKHSSQCRRKGGKNQYGEPYGAFHVQRPRRRMVRAHRWLWEMLIGMIPDGYELDHRCNNTRCVNLQHLEPKPGPENAARANTERAERRKADRRKAA